MQHSPPDQRVGRGYERMHWERREAAFEAGLWNDMAPVQRARLVLMGGNPVLSGASCSLNDVLQLRMCSREPVPCISPR